MLRLEGIALARVLVSGSSLLLACGDGGKAVDDEFDEPAPVSCEVPEDQGDIFFVSVDGSDEAGTGAAQSPWATISHAIRQIPDGSTLLVGPGTYEGRVRLDSQFAEGVMIRAEPTYQAKLRNSAVIVTVFEGKGITLSGFDIAHSGEGADPLLIQVQDLIGDPGGDDAVSRITFRNNIIHDSFNNDLLKLNNGAREILIERNVFYNQTGSDEHIDVNSVVDVTIQDNIFFNDFEASGRQNQGETSSFIVVKDSNGSEDSFKGSERVVIRRNVFANYQGSAGANFVLIGEDGNPFYEADTVLIENNLLVGNSDVEVRAPFGVKGARNITFRNNTIVGDMPGAAYGFRFNVEGDNPNNEGLELYNNVWSDPTGTMGDFSDTPIGETDSFVLDNNLYFNGGSALPNEGDDLINITNDEASLEGDPLLPNTEATMPTWDEEKLRFREGSGDACVAFERLVESFGQPAAGSPVFGAARVDQSPETDILGRRRPSSPAVGAVEAAN